MRFAPLAQKFDEVSRHHQFSYVCNISLVVISHIACPYAYQQDSKTLRYLPPVQAIIPQTPLQQYFITLYSFLQSETLRSCNRTVLQAAINYACRWPLEIPYFLFNPSLPLLYQQFLLLMSFIANFLYHFSRKIASFFRRLCPSVHMSAVVYTRSRLDLR